MQINVITTVIDFTVPWNLRSFTRIQCEYMFDTVVQEVRKDP
jgi:hypothetical protein